MIHEDLYSMDVLDGNGNRAYGLVELQKFTPYNYDDLRSWNDTVQRGSGVLFTGKMTDRGHDFTICLRGIDGPKLFLCLYVDNAKEKYIMRSEFIEELFNKRPEIEIHVGKPVQLYINFVPDGSKLRVFMAPNDNGYEKWELVKELALKMDLPVEERIINFVQLLGNFQKDGGYYPPYMPPALPYKETDKFDVVTVVTEVYEIVGVILPREKGMPKFNVKFTDGNYFIKDDGGNKADSLIAGLDFNFVTNKIKFNSQNIIETGDESLEIGENPLIPAEYFQLRIRFFEKNETVDGNANLAWNFELLFNSGKIVPGIKDSSTNLEVQKIRKIAVDGDVLLLQKPAFVKN